MKLRYWRRDGSECEEAEFLRLQCDPEYRRIAEETVGTTRVTTVWLGHDFECDLMEWREKPKPFGTLVSPNGEIDSDSYEERYESEAQAREGHARIVAGLRAGAERGQT